MFAWLNNVLHYVIENVAVGTLTEHLILLFATAALSVPQYIIECLHGGILYISH